MKKKLTITIHELTQNFAGMMTPEREINSDGKVDVLVEEKIIDEFKFFMNSEKPGDNFHSLLFLLIMKADRDNLMRISRGFPNEVFLVRSYQNICNFAQEYIL